MHAFVVIAVLMIPLQIVVGYDHKLISLRVSERVPILRAKILQPGYETEEEDKNAEKQDVNTDDVAKILRADVGNFVDYYGFDRAQPFIQHLVEDTAKISNVDVVVRVYRNDSEQKLEFHGGHLAKRSRPKRLHRDQRKYLDTEIDYTHLTRRQLESLLKDLRAQVRRLVMLYGLRHADNFIRRAVANAERRLNILLNVKVRSNGDATVFFTPLYDPPESEENNVYIYWKPTGSRKALSDTFIRTKILRSSPIDMDENVTNKTKHRKKKSHRKKKVKTPTTILETNKKENDKDEHKEEKANPNYENDYQNDKLRKKDILTRSNKKKKGKNKNENKKEAIEEKEDQEEAENNDEIQDNDNENSNSDTKNNDALRGGYQENVFNALSDDLIQPGTPLEFLEPKWVVDLKKYVKSLISQYGRDEALEKLLPILHTLERRHRVKIRDIDVNKYGEVTIDYKKLGKSNLRRADNPKFQERYKEFLEYLRLKYPDDQEFLQKMRDSNQALPVIYNVQNEAIGTDQTRLPVIVLRDLLRNT